MSLRFADEFIEWQLLSVSPLDLQGVLLQTREHIAKEVEVLLAFLLEQALHVVQLDEWLLASIGFVRCIQLRSSGRSW